MYLEYLYDTCKIVALCDTGFLVVNFRFFFMNPEIMFQKINWDQSIRF
jgi:hypothetical protein